MKNTLKMMMVALFMFAFHTQTQAASVKENVVCACNEVSCVCKDGKNCTCKSDKCMTKDQEEPKKECSKEGKKKSCCKKEQRKNLVARKNNFLLLTNRKVVRMG